MMQFIVSDNISKHNCSPHSFHNLLFIELQLAVTGYQVFYGRHESKQLTFPSSPSWYKRKCHYLAAAHVLFLPSCWLTVSKTQKYTTRLPPGDPSKVCQARHAAVMCSFWGHTGGLLAFCWGRGQAGKPRREPAAGRARSGSPVRGSQDWDALLACILQGAHQWATLHP